jgi:hypothetical protein
MNGFAIEYAEGLGATVYVGATLSAGDLLELHRSVEQLPSAAKVLRIQVTTDALSGLPSGLGEFVRHWRESRRRPVHLVFVAPKVRPASPSTHSAGLGRAR